MDPTTTSILGFVGQMGSAGGAIFMAWMFITYLKSQSQGQAELITALRELTEALKRGTLK